MTLPRPLAATTSLVAGLLLCVGAGVLLLLASCGRPACREGEDPRPATPHGFVIDDEAHATCELQR